MKKTSLKLVACGVVTLGLPMLAASGSEDTFDRNDYVRAETLISHHLGDTVRNQDPKAHWIGDRDELWYLRDDGTGTDAIVVNAATGEKRPAYKADRLAAAIGSATGSDVPDGSFVTTLIDEVDEVWSATVMVGLQVITCDLGEYVCEVKPLDVPQPGTLPSPDGSRHAFARNHDLWLRDAESGEERRLTEDGTAQFAYGGYPDQMRLEALRSGRSFPMPLSGTHWSPDGRRLLIQRLDERDVLEYPFLESSPPGGSARPRVHSVRIPLLGDPGQRRTETFLIDVETGEQRVLELPDGFSLDLLGIGNRPVSWSEDAEKAFVLANTDGAKKVRLLEVDMRSGSTRTIIEENESTSVSLGHDLMAGPNVRILQSAREVIWFSERDGWGHLYLHDLDSGKVKRQITTGKWTVWEIIRVDGEERRLFFTAGGREEGSDPYLRKLYRASLDGGEIVLLTPEEADHVIRSAAGSHGEASDGSVSASGRYFFESYSTVSMEPRFVVRSTAEGRVIAELEKADAIQLYAAGWRAPERFSVTSADGVTDLYGVVYFPLGFDERGSYPVIDAIYGGQVSIVAARSFRQAYASGYQQASLAELGFVVVSLDGRGTPYRSKAFREIGFGSFADPQLDDHIAAIRQLAKRYPGLDLERVGIYGHSNGGYLAARALLRHPDFFTVGVASAGPQNFQGLPGTGTPWMGIPRYEGGATVRSDDGSVPENYQILDNASFASGLEGHLLLVCGDMDSAAFPALTLQLADALIREYKSFDLLYLPNRTHRYFVAEPYVMRRTWDYLVEHLLGATPPENYKMKPFGQLVF